MSKKSSTQNIKAIDCSQKAAKLKDSEVFESWVLNRPKMSGPYYSWKVDIALKVGRLAAFSTAKAPMKLKNSKKNKTFGLTDNLFGISIFVLQSPTTLF